MYNIKLERGKRKLHTVKEVEVAGVLDFQPIQQVYCGLYCI